MHQAEDRAATCLHISTGVLAAVQTQAMVNRAKERRGVWAHLTVITTTVVNIACQQYKAGKAVPQTLAASLSVVSHRYLSTIAV